MASKTKGWGILLLLGGVLALLASSSSAQSKSADYRAKSNRGLSALLPAFKTKIAGLLYKLRLDGFDPILAAVYFVKDSPRAGLAVDIVPVKELWNAPKAFKDSLHKHALAMGLVRVYSDSKQLQWSYVAAAPPDEIDKLKGAGTDGERDDMLRKWYGEK